MKHFPMVRTLAAGAIFTASMAAAHADSLVAVTLSNGDIDEYYVEKGTFNANAAWTRVRTIATVPDIYGITFNPADDTFYGTTAGNSNQVIKITRDGVVTVLAKRGTGTPGWTTANPQGIEIGPDGQLYFSTAFGGAPNGNGVFSYDLVSGTFAQFIAQAGTGYTLNNARDLQWGGNDLYVSARNSNAVYRFDQNGNYVSGVTSGVTGASGLGIDGTTMMVATNAGGANALRKIDDFATAPVAGSLTATSKGNPMEVAMVEGQRHYLTFNTGAGGAADMNRINPDGSSTVMATFNQPVARTANDFVVYEDEDSDGDGLPDGWELAKLGTLDQGAGDDGDLDGLTNMQEYLAGTHPALADTDGDGISDGAEVNRTVGGIPAPTNPTLADTDGDGIPDGAETNTGVFVSAADTGTNPLLADTDGDSFDDYVEISRGSNPLLASSIPGATGTDPLVKLSAASLSAGPLSSWPNTGTLGSSFNASTTPPVVATVGGVKGVTFSGSEVMTGMAAPPDLTGNHSRTVAAWVFNPQAANEEEIVSWGRRGGPNGTNASFGHGTNPAFGAVGGWGADADLGYGSTSSVKTGRWTYLVYTYNGTTKDATIFVDGQLTNQKTLAAVLNTWAVDNSPYARPLPIRLGGSNAADGSIDQGDLKASLTLASLMIYDHVVSDAKLGFADTDNDGMPDWYELFYGFNINVDDSASDPDGDTLDNFEEFMFGTSPILADTDGDGLRDDYETETSVYVSPTNTGTSPLLADTDGDGLSDGVETNTGIFISILDTGTDPNTPDSDFDGVPDGLEVLTYGTDPNSDADRDGDGLTDAEEILIYHTDPLLADTDGDGFGDKVEVDAGSSPTDPLSTPDNIPGYSGTLVHQYKLDETSGTIANDSVGSLDGTIGPDVLLGQPGRDGTAVRFPVTATADSKVLLPNALVPDGAAPFTASAWVRLSAPVADGGQIQLLSANNGQAGRWNLGILDAEAGVGVDAQLFWFHNGGLNQQNVTGFNFNDHVDEWIQVAISRSSTGLTTLYINGVGTEIGTSRGTLSNTAAGVSLGSRPNAAQDGLNGLMDDVRFYDGGLAPADLLALYNSYDTTTDYDSWALGYGLNPTGNGAKTADADGDGTLNGVEFLLGLIPNDGSSRFATTVSGTPATGFTLTWPSQPGLQFVVKSSTNLIDFELVETIPAAPTPATTTSWSSGPVTGPKKFFRVELAY